METPTPKVLTPRRMLLRGLARRCPLCGSGKMFSTFFRVKERCPRCNFPIHREEGYWIGAIGMNTIASFGLLLVTLLVVFTLTWNERRGAVVFVPSIAVAGLTPVLFFGTSQTLWSAVHLWMRPVEPADDVDPRYLPAPRQHKHPPLW